MDTKIRPIYKPAGDPLQTQRHIQTESKRMEKKNIPCKWKPKESWSGNPYFRQNKLNKEYHKRQRKTLHNDQGINPRHSNCKSLCSQHRSTSYIWQTLTGIRGEINSNTIIVGDFNTNFHQWKDHQNRESVRKHKP